MATFAEVVNNQNSNKNNTDESDSKHGEQNKDYASSDSVKPLFLVDQDVIYLYVGEPVSSIGFGGTKHVLID
jgi:hypothetical protein